MTTELGQAGQPRGVIGRLLGRFMVWHNHPDSRWSIACLQPQAGERVLEIGFGPGHGIQLLTQYDDSLTIVGIDHSRDMLAMAKARNRLALQSGRVQLGLGSVMQLPFASASFDKVMSVNCIYFWDTPLQGLLEIHRVLCRGGSVAITVRDRQRERYIPFRPQALIHLLTQAGFLQVDVQSNHDARHPLFCATGCK